MTWITSHQGSLCQGLKLSRLVREVAHGFITREGRELVSRTLSYSLWWLYPDVLTLSCETKKKKWAPFPSDMNRWVSERLPFASPEVWILDSSVLYTREIWHYYRGTGWIYEPKIMCIYTTYIYTLWIFFREDIMKLRKEYQVGTWNFPFLGCIFFISRRNGFELLASLDPLLFF